ncbi:hypothetical protein ACLK2F_05270 [Escherichia coli]
MTQRIIYEQQQQVKDVSPSC